MRRIAFLLNAILAAFAVVAAVMLLRGTFPDPEFVVPLCLVPLVPSLAWLAALKTPKSFALALLALVMNAIGMSAALFILSGFLGLAAASGSRADPAVVTFSLVWAVTAALNIRSAWADRAVAR